jgi:hypothetical protein
VEGKDPQVMASGKYVGTNGTVQERGRRAI